VKGRSYFAEKDDFVYESPISADKHQRKMLFAYGQVPEKRYWRMVKKGFGELLSWQD
jgi:hypothetical protein